VDSAVVVWVTTHRIGALNVLFEGFGTIEKLGIVWIVIALVIGAVQRRGASGTVLLSVTVALATFAADAASFGIKDVTNRPRPFEAHPQIHPLYAVHSSSFPAGHAATAFAGAAVLAYAARPAAPVLFAVATVIGLSRIYVGDHYPTDVLGGAAVGLAVGAVAVAAFRLVTTKHLGLRLAGTSGGAPNVSS
jgi:undecaprenyl-diphosphatase